ncbi:hypothetical protein AAH084_03180, partial [Bacteroides faecis]
MGTIDISYYNLFIGLLLLAIPFFYLWKFRTGLLKPAVTGTLRMIVPLKQLEQFPFLSDIQIEHLLAYIYVHGQ